MAILILKRVGTLLSELIAEALLLGFLFVALLAGRVPNDGSLSQRSAAGLLVAGPLVVVTILFLFWYYATRPILGLLWSRNRPWQYAAIASMLFAIHASVATVCVWSDLSVESKRVLPAFVALGALLVLCCARLGRRFLREKLVPGG